MSDENEVVHFWDLRYEVDQASQRYADLLAERDRLRAVVAEVVFHIGPVTPANLPRDAASGDGIVPYEQVPRLVDQVVIQRDRLRAVVDGYLIALLPGTAPAVRQEALDALASAVHWRSDQLDVSPTMGEREGAPAVPHAGAPDRSHASGNPDRTVDDA